MGVRDAMADAFTDRARGAFLGLAAGDAFGRPLEFIKGPSVRTRTVDVSPGAFRWTDDTHMAMYLARAVLNLPPGRLNRDAFGTAVGEQFVLWSHDPLTPTTAPGNTCLRGTAAYERGRNWRTSGDPESDGCGAVMRICPLAMAFEGEALTEAARVSAIVTHAHPNAIEAAIAASHLLRLTLDSGEFGTKAVQTVIAGLKGPWGCGGQVADALEAAVGFAAGDTQEWLDEKSIPTGDGGWRSASALGLAVAAALAWGERGGGGFATAVERAARIDGDSDSVACLVGMYLGAAGGTSVVPPEWAVAIPDRETLLSLVDQLVAWSGGDLLPPSAAAEGAGGRDEVGAPATGPSRTLAAIRAAGGRFVPDRDATTGRTAIKVRKADRATVALLHELADDTGGKVLVGTEYATLLVSCGTCPPSNPVTSPPATTRRAKSDPAAISMGPAARKPSAAPGGPAVGTPGGRGDGRAVTGSRTSATDPIRVNWLEKEAWPHPLPATIGLTFAPGKCGPSTYGRSWARDLDVDLDRLAAVYRVELLVSLVEGHELETWKIEPLVEHAAARGIVVYRLPTPDLGVPSVAAATAAVDLMIAFAKAGRNAVVHCRGGLGRAGTLAACCLARAGVAPAAAITHVRATRPKAIETTIQEQFVSLFASAVLSGPREDH